MSPTPELSGNWRGLAAFLSLVWLASVLAFMVFTIGGTSHRLAGVGFILVLLASLTVLALLRNLGKVISGEADAPGEWERRLAIASAALLSGGWACLLLS